MIKVCGGINFLTPVCVLREICESCGLNFDDFKYHDSISRCKVPALRKGWRTRMDRDDVKLLSIYVNPNVVWTRKSLILCFDFLNLSHRYMHISSMKGFGRQSIGKEQNLNCCMLYRQCKIRKIKVFRDTSMEKMINLIDLYDRMSIKDIRESLLVIDNKSDLLGCISLCVDLDSYTHKEDEVSSIYLEENHADPLFYKYPTFDELRREIVMQNSILPSLIDPKDNLECICSASIRFGINLSKCMNPMRQYDLLCRGEKTTDPSLEEKDLPTISSSKLHLCFDPSLPIEFYTRKQMSNLMKIEGLSLEDYRSSYTILQTSYLSETFYEGKCPFSEETTCITCEDFSSIDHEDVICFGTRDKSVSFETSSILSSLRTYKSFRNPSKKEHEYFTQIQIMKLERICRNPMIKVSKKAMTIRQSILREIKSISKTIGTKTSTELLINDIYNSDSFSARQIVSIIYLMFEMSMYMRGWDGVSNYPTGSSPVNDQEKVNARVTSSIYKFQNSCENKIGRIFMNLPLYIWRDDEYRRCVDTEMGTRIRERLSLVISGISVYSCIRLSSNWFASTCCKYLDDFGLPTPIDITKMRNIA